MSVDYKGQPDTTLQTKIISVCSDNNREPINTACWQNANFTDVKEEGAYRYHGALKG
jgi:hypothetical protein